VTPQLPKLESFSSLLFRFAFSESKRWESEQKSQIFERENREAGIELGLGMWWESSDFSEYESHSQAAAFTDGAKS